MARALLENLVVVTQKVKQFPVMPGNGRFIIELTILINILTQMNPGSPSCTLILYGSFNLCPLVLSEPLQFKIFTKNIWRRFSSVPSVT
jgi:hypothetical protein